MKKVLFATTALVMTAGVAAADVDLSGDGRMGVVYDGNDFDFTSRARVTFSLSGETDGGLAFGGAFRVDHANSNNGGNGNVYISGAFGKITMGDIDSGAESAVGDLPGVGLTGLNDLNEFAYPGSAGEAANNPGLLYSYAGDNFNVYLSAYDGHNTGFAAPAGVDANAISLGGNYTFNNFTVAAGYTALDYDVAAMNDAKIMAIAGIATFGDVKVTAAYAKADDLQIDLQAAYDAFGTLSGLPAQLVNSDAKQYGIGAETTFGATSVSAFYRKVKAEDLAAGSTAEIEADYYGIGASYDLGGGASLQGGVVKWDHAYDNGAVPAVSKSDIIADFGISFSF